ncbi:MAG: biotin carboxylase N-terminal domain-containing protein [Thermofilum sp.]
MEPPFRKILIANRGEIAVRIIRTARDMGIRTVAVYSDADANALHALLADEKYRLGPGEPGASYLNMDAIIDVALKSGAEAVHPGYGFLAQNALFAEKVVENGLVWIGPHPDVIKLVGDKLGARRFFSSQGIPIVPGGLNPVDLRDAASYAEEIGYPVVVKPAGGGGGIGMFVAWSEEELEEKIKQAAHLAHAYFKNASVYLEKYFPKAKHIEVQVLGWRGGVIHLFERECSVQRRFQKVIEEAPSPSLSWDERKHVCELAVRAASSCGYTNAGTFEFIFDLDTRSFYLLEVNSRIQVEHPVTEAVTGVDIVEQQIRIAGEGKPTVQQGNVEIHAHAIEARIYAEDPMNSFAPSPGKITFLEIPQGPWVRVDSGVYEGYEIPHFYDPLIMKVITWGSSRAQALSRLLRAVSELRIGGIRHNKYLILKILEHPAFREANYTTRMLEDGELLRSLRNTDEAPLLPSGREAEKGGAAQKRVEQPERVNYWRLLARAGSASL